MEYSFDRFVNGVKKAMGARVNANCIETARKKAYSLFPGEENLTFKLRLPPKQDNVTPEPKE